MKKMPNIFKPAIDKELKNNKKTYYSFLETDSYSQERSSPRSSFKINKISNNNYIFNTKVLIKTKTNEYETKIASRMGNNIITDDGRIISIRDIISIDEI